MLSITPLYRLLRKVSPIEVTPEQLKAFIRADWDLVCSGLIQHGHYFENPDDFFAWVDSCEELK